MSKTHIYLILFILILSPIRASVEKNFFINERQYHKEATSWLRKYIIDENDGLLIYPKEAQIIANLIYFSFKRSYLNLEAQHTALETLNTVWKGWQNISQTRLDPSVEEPHKISNDDKAYSLESFWAIHDEHKKTCKTYSKAVDIITNKNFLFTINSHEAVKNMRQEARQVVSQSLINVKNYIGPLFYSKKKPINKAIPLMDHLLEYIPKLALNSFIQANITNDKISNESWNILMKIQNVGKITWQMIEQERAAFYLAFYQAIFYAIQKAELDDEYRKIIFDQCGSINQDHQYEFLPSAKSLTNYYSGQTFLNLKTT